MNLLIDLAFAVLFVFILTLLINGLIYFESRSLSYHRRLISRATEVDP